MDSSTKLRFECQCVVKNRELNESQREWFKRWMCMHHWMQTDYYVNKIKELSEHKWQFYANGTFCVNCGAAIGSGTPCK